MVDCTIFYSFKPPTSGSSSPNSFRKAVWTSSVRSLACRLRPLFLKAWREHSCGPSQHGIFSSRLFWTLEREKVRQGSQRTLVTAHPPKAASCTNSPSSNLPP